MLSDGALLADKVVLVSGGTAGIGAAVAMACAHAGARAVVVTGRRPEPGEELVTTLRELGADARFVKCDVADTAQDKAAVAAVVEAYGRVDCLVNAAGHTARGTLADTTPELFDTHIAINLRGPFFLIQAVVADMRRRGTAGTIVNIGSISELGGPSHLAPYVAAKAALGGLTRNLGHALRADRIRVNTLDIGWTDTDGEDATQRRFHDAGDDWRERAGETLPLGRLGDPAEIAHMAVFLLSDRSGVVTGSVIDWDQTVPGAQG